MPTASYPNFAGEHAGQALFTAADFLAYLRQAGAVDDEAAPGGAVLCYQRSLYDHVLRAEGLGRRRWRRAGHAPGPFGINVSGRRC